MNLITYNKIFLFIFILVSIFFVSCSDINKQLQKENPSPLPITNTQTSENILIPSQITINQILRFIVMADSRGIDNGVNSPIVNKIFSQIKKLSPQPEFALIPGDLVDSTISYDKMKKQIIYFKHIVTKYYPANFFYTGVGNHEVGNNINGEKALGEVFTEFKATFLKNYNRSVYYFDKGTSRFFMLNTDHPGFISSISDIQLNWIKENSKSNADRNFYFFHEPAFPTGAHVGSSLDLHPFIRNKLWNIIQQSLNPLVFCGHEHFYTRRHIDAKFNETVNGIDFIFNKRIFQVTTGTFGAPIYTGFTSKKNVDVPPISQYHFAVVDISTSATKVTVIDINGKIIDNFEQIN